MYSLSASLVYSTVLLARCRLLYSTHPDVFILDICSRNWTEDLYSPVFISLPQYLTYGNKLNVC